MVITNREAFFNDPSEQTLPNLGVAKVRKPEDDDDWATLAWELKSFVCEGEYELGLERILSQYLQHLSQEAQPVAWVSGFYGSGKSHLVRVLEYLWVDPTLPDGESARGMTSLPSEITAHLKELTTAGKREGGLWSATGTLGAGAVSTGRTVPKNSRSRRWRGGRRGGSVRWPSAEIVAFVCYGQTMAMLFQAIFSDADERFYWPHARTSSIQLTAHVH